MTEPGLWQVKDFLDQHAAAVLLGSIACWFLLFGLLERAVRAVTASSGLVLEATPTTPPQEKPTTVQGFAFLALSTLHSSTVAVLSLSTLPGILLGGGEPGTGAGDDLKFNAVAGDAVPVLFIAGYVYTSWALFEVLFFTLHWRLFGKVADMFHHVLFAATGLFFMSHPGECAYYAAVLMAMETSTPWLNLHLAFRASRGAYRQLLGTVRSLGVCAGNPPSMRCSWMRSCMHAFCVRARACVPACVRA